MKKYIGTKIVEAEPASKHEVDSIKGFPIPADEEDRAGYKVRYQDGYISWSPKKVFEGAYRLADGLNFGLALEALKSGKKVSRKGWNGRGLFVVHQKAYPQGIPCNKQTAEAWGLEEGDLFKCEPYLQINTVDGSHAMWVPSIRDCLAEDWEVVE
jgi:hypothetical protein